MLALSQSHIFDPGLAKILGTGTDRESQTVSLILTGDIMLGRSVMTTSLRRSEPSYPFAKVAGKLREADLVFANLENPIVPDCPWVDDGFRFCADSRMTQGLVFAGIDVVTLANNHTLNYGQQGLEQTMAALDEHGISYTGTGNLTVLEAGDASFGFLGFDAVSADLSESDWELVSISDLLVDVLVVGIHWGSEYTEQASPRQRQLAAQLVERGADVVAGHHPHWVQNIEYIDGVPVYYSLGNFVFDQMWSEETRTGLAVKLSFKAGEIVGQEQLPIYMSQFAQPEWRQ
jgi:poly-gamma-glutamate synthesis protein (capsule biosynthesis protein)